MEIKNEEDARQAISKWRDYSLSGRLSNLRQAMQTLELNQMYFEQKGNEPGVLRVENCLTILKQELSNLTDDK
ncbi:MAG: hypothetical protein KKB30_00895 [Proteobacteria bacterium]|nr:hypothetical protein [Pseudomonadota bacterium]MBU1715369.1 hypothetical protein [Pseudomonadota bacterium]